MLAYALRRLLLAVPLLLGITFISFMVIHLAPGDPVEVQSGDMTERNIREAYKALREMYGLDKPLHVQYWNWLSRIVRLDFGRSFAPDGRPVLTKISERLPITLLLNVVEMLIILALAVPIGVLSATRQYSHVRQGHHDLRLPRLRHPGLLAGAAADDPLRRAARLAAHLRPALAQLGVPDVLGPAAGLPQPPGAADPGRHLRRPGRVLALHAPEHAGGGPPGLHPDGAGQGAGRARGRRQARAAQRHAADRHHPRASRCRA